MDKIIVNEFKIKVRYFQKNALLLGVSPIVAPFAANYTNLHELFVKIRVTRGKRDQSNQNSIDSQIFTKTICLYVFAKS
jgi:hypothetical protein